MNERPVGIDLGTTNSVIAFLNDAGRPEVIPNAAGNRITPSVLYFGSDPPLIGEDAKEMQGMGEEDIGAFFKRSMGDAEFLITLGGKDYTPVDLSALLLAQLKRDAEAALGAPVTQAVITVPAYFQDLQRTATIEAGKKAGLEVLRIINEPTAAALAYGLHKTGGEQLLLVYDLGGGTFDVSLVRISNDEITVIATDGDHNLGGKDWDDRITTYVAEEFESLFGTSPLNDNVSINDLLVRAEEAKKALSSSNSTRLRVQHEGNRETFELTRTQFAEMTSDLMERTQRLCNQVLVDANTQWTDLTGVLLVGGSTRMPMVHDYVSQMSGKAPMMGVNVDEAVASGAAIQAAIDLAEKSGDSLARRLVLPSQTIRDVMSHSLGTIAVDQETRKFINSIIIKRNQPIPCQQSKEYEVRTSAGGDNTLEVYMLQGEHEDPLQCTVLGKYVFSGIAHVPRIPAIVEIEFGYDRSGVITVSAKQLPAGNELKLDVQPLSEDMNWLKDVSSAQHGGLKLPYTRHAGQQHIPGAATDQYGNADGSQYDLADDHAFEGYLVAVLHLYTAENFDFRQPTIALEQKGFAIQRWTSVPSEQELARVLEEASQLWVISSNIPMLKPGHIEIIKEFFDAGHGLYIWGDNDPFFADANKVAQRVLNCQLTGNSPGDQVLQPQSATGRPGFTGHLITTGIENMYEGITVSTIKGGDLEPLTNGSDNKPLISYYDKNGKRAIVDGGFTRLFFKWDTAGTGRYVKNAACWLVNIERLLEEQSQASGLAIRK